MRLLGQFVRRLLCWHRYASTGEYAHEPDGGYWGYRCSKCGKRKWLSTYEHLT